MSDTPITDEMAEKHPSWPNTAVHFACKLERELAVANRIIKECLSVMPVGYIPSHTPENLPAKIEGLLKELAENTTIRHERVAEELAEVKKQRDVLAKSFQLVWKHLKGERIRHDYITGTMESGDLKTLQEVCKEALAAVKGGEL